MALVTICIMAEKLNSGSAAMENLEDVLNHAGYRVVNKIGSNFNEKHKRWETWYQCRYDEKSWCAECQEYTVKTYGSWAYKGYKECADCGRREYL